MAEADEKFEGVSDEELVKLAHGGDKRALETLLFRYKNLVYAKAKPYFLAGADDDDIIQEGFIGLYKAIMNFDGGRLPFFGAFASVCVSRHIITAVKAASRQKHIPLNSYVSLDNDSYDEGERLVDVMTSGDLHNPEAILIDRESIDGIGYKINKALSKLELNVLVHYLKGMPYQEIADLMDKDVKSIDNAIQRIRKKLENILNER